jgi:hypothetical protein
MKELNFPWVHWHSPPANIFPEAFGASDDPVTHPWFESQLGGDACGVTLRGGPLRFGSQLAERVGVRLTALVIPGTHRPEPQPCVRRDAT